MATLTVGREWSVSPLVTGEIFRLRHPSQFYGDGLVCQALIVGTEISTFDTRQMYANNEPEIISFVPFWGMTERRLAFKSLVQYEVPWIVTLERYVNDIIPSDSPVLYSTVNSLISAAVADKVTADQLTIALATIPKEIVLTTTTTGNTPTDMTTPQRVTIQPNATVGYEIQLVGHSMNPATPEYIYWLGSGVVYRGATAASTTLQSPTGTRRSSLGAGSNWTPTIAADKQNGGLKITVKGDPGKTIQWKARVQLTEVF